LVGEDGGVVGREGLLEEQEDRQDGGHGGSLVGGGCVGTVVGFLVGKRLADWAGWRPSGSFDCGLRPPLRMTIFFLV
jgi:hypothetical protein